MYDARKLNKDQRPTTIAVNKQLSLDAPCPHPGRNGKHEIYLRVQAGEGPLYCRACGAVDEESTTR